VGARVQRLTTRLSTQCLVLDLAARLPACAPTFTISSARERDILLILSARRHSEVCVRYVDACLSGMSTHACQLCRHMPQRCKAGMSTHACLVCRHMHASYVDKCLGHRLHTTIWKGTHIFNGQTLLKVHA
jgi:hypothetical protein